MEVARLSESLAFRSCLIRQFQQGYTVSYAYVLTWFSCVWVSTISSYCPPNAYFFSVFCTCFAWVLFSVFLFAKHWTVRLRKERGTWFFLAWWKPRRVAPSPFELHPKTQFNVMIIILISSRHKSPQNVLTPFFCYRSLFFFFFSDDTDDGPLVNVAQKMFDHFDVSVHLMWKGNFPTWRATS